MDRSPVAYEFCQTYGHFSFMTSFTLQQAFCVQSCFLPFPRGKCPEIVWVTENHTTSLLVITSTEQQSMHNPGLSHEWMQMLGRGQMLRKVWRWCDLPVVRMDRISRSRCKGACPHFPSSAYESRGPASTRTCSQLVLLFSEPCFPAFLSPSCHWKPRFPETSSRRTLCW